jgi:hypothetical protein
VHLLPLFANSANFQFNAFQKKKNDPVHLVCPRIFVSGRYTSEPKVGHFTQLMWKETTKLGCALSTTGTNTAGCRYTKAGNVLGHFDQNVQPECSKSRQQCENEVGWKFQDAAKKATIDSKCE